MVVNTSTRWIYLVLLNLVIWTIFLTILYSSSESEEEEDLCAPFTEVKRRTTPVSCKKHGYLTAFHGGQLGNQMSHYATLYAHSKRLGVKTVILSEMRKKLSRHFPFTSFRPTSDRCKWKWSDVWIPNIYDLTPESFETKNIMIREYVFHFEAFRHYQHQLISEEFAFDPHLLSDAKSFLSEIRNQTKNKRVLLVSIHARRTDYKKWMAEYVRGYVASQKFYLAAMNVFRKKYNTKETQVVFVLASDDVGWCRKVFANETDLIYAASANSTYSKFQPTFDLAVLANCDHSIVSCGTFGFWTAFLKGKGDTIIVTGTSSIIPYVESNLREVKHNWIYLQDPCYVSFENKTTIKEECTNLD